NIHNVGVDGVVKAAIAEFQYRLDIDYIVDHADVDGQRQKFVFLIDRVNGEVRHDPELNNDVRITNDIHKALEAKENLREEAAGRAGVPIRHDVEGPKEKQTTSTEYYNEVRVKDGRHEPTSTISGTAIESSELMAANYERLGPVI